ncbi:DUF6250 domain-containing protein [Aestuariibaculum suncheonense]|uniref:DUF6250 domain-containing protein n=1 Tax=Aestuariibaculum suncheonense TaxID=1028745 RepID=A0A8J6Q6P7_9FLAO|nr:DUF6250 domain-containing protein [Aestuariibaculum suncheonense]MBD0835673.1 hypothetical protein [Aestuariibaculum suncheonense]
MISILRSTIIATCILLNSCSSKKIIHDNVLKDKSNWVIEQQPGGEVLFGNKSIEVIDAKGCTIWFKNKLKGAIKIQYDITIIDKGGIYDRVSDMNCFWMATDPHNPQNFFKESRQRAGYFPNYHHLKLYYVGYGGHHNTKTRFRRYNGDINRPLLPEHDLSDEKFMIIPNKTVQIEIIVKDNYTSYSREGEKIFEIVDSEPYKSGYFGFRTVNNHMKIENFKVTQLN